MAKRKKTPLPPQKATVEAIWWRDPYAKDRTSEAPITYGYCCMGIVWKETERYVVIAREVTAQDEDYLSERDDQKIYKSLIYHRHVIGEVMPYRPIDDDEEDEPDARAADGGDHSAGVAGPSASERGAGTSVEASESGVHAGPRHS